MKTLKVALMASLLIVIFASVSIVSAASTTMQGTATGYWSVTKPSPGSYVTVTINFQSSSSDRLYVYAIGLHGDWMGDKQFAGPDYNDQPETVETGGLLSAKVTIQIPASADLGSHSYYIGIDGVDANGESFSWDSSSYNIEFAVGTNPTPTGQATQNGGASNPTGNVSQNSILIYVAVIAVVAVVAILLAILVVKKSGKKHAPKVETAEPEPTYIPPESPKSEQETQPEPTYENEPETEPEAEPEEKPNNKDFTI